MISTNQTYENTLLYTNIFYNIIHKYIHKKKLGKQFGGANFQANAKNVRPCVIGGGDCHSPFMTPNLTP